MCLFHSFDQYFTQIHMYPSCTQVTLSVDPSKDLLSYPSKITGQSFELQADLLIAADGANSKVRRLALINGHDRSEGRSRAEADVNLALLSLLKRRGYKVYRGHSSGSGSGSSLNAGGASPDMQTDASPGSGNGAASRSAVKRISDVAFQTWGPRTRFACVPTKTGNAWFAAVTSEIRTSLLMSDLFVDKKDNQALGNDSELVSKGEFDNLRERLINWHDPIGDLLSGTDQIEGSGISIGNSDNSNDSNDSSSVSDGYRSFGARARDSE
jgi:hypothetical protein